ncbi:hypothetical protein TWF481_009023 [Arthrobotrys musiformis]|uniref:Uncharacterized protein n=1 Tax=Arthrobotrys musiformis TaxID=47236 RepID=A0AAV9W4Q4_9PEZI
MSTSKPTTDAPQPDNSQNPDPRKENVNRYRKYGVAKPHTPYIGNTAKNGKEAWEVDIEPFPPPTATRPAEKKLLVPPNWYTPVPGNKRYIDRQLGRQVYPWEEGPFYGCHAGSNDWIEEDKERKNCPKKSPKRERDGDLEERE